MGRRPYLRRALQLLVPRAARNWIRSPGQSLEWGADRARFLLGRVERLEMRPDWTLCAHPLAVRRAFSAQLHDPEQRAELDAFIRTCRPGMRLLDVGAHFGIFSLAALRYGGPSATAVAIDPSPTATRMIALHARLNGVQGRLRIVQACAGQRTGERGMLATGVIGAGYFVSADPDRPASDLSRVPEITVDAICDRFEFEPTHIKIDVEGDEVEVLEGAVGVLSRRRPVVALELHNRQLESRGRMAADIVGRLESLGYECGDVLSGRIQPVTFTRDVSRLIARVPAPALPGS